MKFISSLFVLLLFSSVSFADNDFGVLVGFRSNSAETDLGGATISSKSSYQFGALANLDLYSNMALRTGLMVVGRQVGLAPTAKGKVEFNFFYVDVPLTALFRFSNMAGIFVGPVLSFNQSKETTCSLNTNCVSNNVNSVVIPWQLGVSFRFAYQMGAELYYEYVPGDLATNLSNMKTVGANFLFYFE